MNWHTALLAGSLAFFFTGTAMAAEPMTLADYMALNGPAPNAHIAYGGAASQYVELFVPPGSGPFPVVLLVHGGCWLKEFQGITQMRNLAGALLAQGIATWNVEYRRVDEDGGGYPGTYQDVAAALDLLIAQAATHKLDTHRLVAVGHSAGGHLVQWLAGRPVLPPSSPLYQAQPFPVKHVIALGSIGDLRHRASSLKSTCGVEAVQLTGPPSAGRPDVYSDTSPAELMPNGSTTVLINGALDSISPPQTAGDYAARALQAGDKVSTLVLPQASHFDEVAASSPAWALILPVIRGALGDASRKQRP
jgi:acetyl esterase/lipase